MPEPHRPVMLAEVLEVMAPGPGSFLVDVTLGAAGHAAPLLEASSPGGFLLGLDLDPEALELARDRLSGLGERFELNQSGFDRLPECLAGRKADGILADLGVSSMQLDRQHRGFSFRREAPLDLRMGPEGESAAELLARVDETELSRILGRLGEEPFSRRIARHIVKARETAPVATTARLAGLVQEALPAKEAAKRRLHPATKVFLALRLYVNDELGRLARLLEAAPGCLAPGGVLAFITYHSLEDRLVKRAFRRWADPCTCPPDLGACVCGLKPVFAVPERNGRVPGEAEIRENPRARSARLRWGVRTEAWA